MELREAVSKINGGLSATPETSTTALLKEYRNRLIAVKEGLDEFPIWLEKQRESFPFLWGSVPREGDDEEISEELRLFEEGKLKLGEEQGQTQMKAAFTHIRSWFMSKRAEFLKKRDELIFGRSSLFSERHRAVADELDQFAKMLNGDTGAHARELAECFRLNPDKAFYQIRRGDMEADMYDLRDIANELKDKDDSLRRMALFLADEVNLESWNTKWRFPLVELNLPFIREQLRESLHIDISVAQILEILDSNGFLVVLAPSIGDNLYAAKQRNTFKIAHSMDEVSSFTIGRNWNNSHVLSANKLRGTTDILLNIGVGTLNPSD
jgi:hypothetical protein